MAVSPRRPRIIPVMDIRGGIVVRAIAGRREEYKPLVSRLTHSTDPLVVAEALRIAASTDEIYVADLDAILGGPRNLAMFEALANRGHRIWADAGIQKFEDAIDQIEAGVEVVIGGLETLRDVAELGMLGDLRGDQVAFSLDLRNGIPVGRPEVIKESVESMLSFLTVICSVRRLIVLDVCRVGSASGTGTIETCTWAKSKYSHVELIAGGGVRGPEDLPALADAGVDAVLVASALHDGKFGLPEAAL